MVFAGPPLLFSFPIIKGSPPARPTLNSTLTLEGERAGLCSERGTSTLAKSLEMKSKRQRRNAAWRARDMLNYILQQDSHRQMRKAKVRAEANGEERHDGLQSATHAKRWTNYRRVRACILARLDRWRRRPREKANCRRRRRRRVGPSSFLRWCARSHAVCQLHFPLATMAAVATTTTATTTLATLRARFFAANTHTRRTKERAHSPLNVAVASAPGLTLEAIRLQRWPR